MKKLADWIKANKILSVVLLTLFIYWILFAPVNNIPYTTNTMMGFDGGYAPAVGSFGGGRSSKLLNTSIYQESAPQMDVANRMVVTNSNLSLAVKDVVATMNAIKNRTKEMEGYMVNSSQVAPEGPVSGNITIRVPADRLEEALSFLRGQAVKVVSENISGYDITDEYVDVDSRLQTLERTKARYEEILASAQTVEEILQVTNNILNIQDQIDAFKGRAEYLKNSASSTLITVYLSTDEFELPYAPENPWRPEVVFKYAVRALVTDLRELGSAGIRIAVYSVIWLPVLVFSFFAIRKIKRMNNSTN